MNLLQPSENKPLFTIPAILFHPQIPKPLHGLNPRSILGDEWWNEQRQKAYAENNYHCWACGIHKSEAKYHQWLEAHECYRIDYQRGISEMIEIVALCHSCHNYIHAGRMKMMVDKGEMDISKFRDILAHGNRVKLTPCEMPANLAFTLASLQEVERNNHIAKWNDWRLIINGIEYEPLHKSFEEWREFYK